MKFITIKYQPRLVWGLIGVMMFGLLVVGVSRMPQGGPIKQAKVAEQSETILQKPSSEVSQIKKHTVQSGETLSTIAKGYGIDVDTLKGANENLSEEIQPGDELVILPSKGILHTADMGDTLWQLANVYDVAVATIMNANGKTDEAVAIGEKLFVPGAKVPQQMERQLARGDEPVSRSSSNRFIWPAAGEMSSPYGYRWGRLHAGLDLANDTGTVIRAARSGRVSYVGWYSGYGYTVMIEHDQDYVTLYGHLSDYVVQRGQYVKSGQIIAHMGNTGNSTGPHLHFEVHKNGTPINPYTVLP